MAQSSPSMQPWVHASPHALIDQPGLEAVPQDHLPEVRPDEDPKFYVPPTQHQEQKIHHAEDFPQVVAGNGELEVASPASTGKSTLPVPDSYRRRKWWIIGGTACVVAVIVVAVTVGVVLSLKSRKNSSDDNVSAEDGNGTIANTRPETMRPGSSLAAGGWRKPNGDVERYLFYQDFQGQIRRLRSIASKANTTSTWEALPPLDLGAANGTKLAATVFNNPGSNLHRWILCEWAFDHGQGAGLAAYWPYVVTQHESGHIIEARKVPEPDSARLPNFDWRVRNLTYSAYEGSALCIVPTSSNFTKISAPGGYAVVYQKPNQGMAFNVTDIHRLDNAYAASLPDPLPDQYVYPPATPIAAFAVARNSNMDDDHVNIYIIFKTYATGFGVWFTENLSKWMEESPAALNNVDEDSDIACSTLASTNSNWEGKEVLLEPANGEVRCYFQRGGRVVEVSFTGSTWNELGVVPIP